MGNKFKITEGDLVKMAVKLPEGMIYPWFRVLFVDLDDTFIGNLEKEISLYEKQTHPHLYEHHRFSFGLIKEVLPKGELPEGKEWCYSDGFTVCDCPGLCRNK